MSRLKPVHQILHTKHQRGNLSPGKGKRKRQRKKIPKDIQNLIQKLSLELAESITIKETHLGLVNMTY